MASMMNHGMLHDQYTFLRRMQATGGQFTAQEIREMSARVSEPGNAVATLFGVPVSVANDTPNG